MLNIDKIVNEIDERIEALKSIRYQILNEIGDVSQLAHIEKDNFKACFIFWVFYPAFLQC